MAKTLENNQIEQELQSYIEQARTACSTNGALSHECAAAWDAVEEIQAAIADRRMARAKNSLQEYCEERPDALECRIYDV
jgi:uncharacterized protein YgiB involved in biofilm formation